MSPALRGMVLTPICPHTLTNRPLVVPASARLTVQLGEAARNVVLTVDGQWATQLGHRDLIEVHEANKPLRLYRPLDVSYFDILRSKLHWGERAGHRRGDEEAISTPMHATPPAPRR
jgi:NAD+ kinase